MSTPLESSSWKISSTDYYVCPWVFSGKMTIFLYSFFKVLFGNDKEN